MGSPTELAVRRQLEELVRVEAPSRFELLDKGFADPPLSHLGTAPESKLYPSRFADRATVNALKPLRHLAKSELFFYKPST